MAKEVAGFHGLTFDEGSAINYFFSGWKDTIDNVSYSGQKYNIHLVVLSKSILAWNYQFTTTRNTLINILIISLESNRVGNNKTKVEITQVFKIVLQCSMFLKHISDWNNTSFQN